LQKVSLSEETFCRSDDFTVFPSKTPAKFQNPSFLTIKKTFSFKILCRIKTLFRSIWKRSKTLPKTEFPAFTESSKKAGRFYRPAF
jgi:hypothetical protein